MAGATSQGTLQFLTTLSGAMEVPPVATPARGISQQTYNPTLRTLTVGLTVSNLRQVTQAHIHLGRPGENGPVVLFLYGPAAPRDFLAPTMITSATYTAANLTGPLMGMPLSALIAHMLAGNAYVNVHTVANPNGEIRGQIMRR